MLFPKNYQLYVSILSPKGDRIAFCSDKEGQFNIYVMDREGREVKRLTSEMGNCFWPSWVNDSTLVFDSNATGNQELFSIRDDGSQLTQLTFDTTAYDGVANTSATGKIIFDSNRDPDGLADVWTMNPDGDEQNKITFQNLSQGHGALSPDESRIVYKIKLNDAVQELFEMNFEGDNARQLTNLHAVSLHPFWSPDGSHVIFTSNTDGDFDVYVIELASGQVKQLINNSWPDYRPSYSPDGRSVLFCSKVDDVWQICILEIRSGKITQLTY